MDAREPRHQRRAPLVGGLAALLVGALVLGSVASGAGPVPAPPGIPDAGAWTGWALRLADAAALLVAVLTTGSLLVAAVLLAPDGDGDHEVRDARRRATRAAAGGAAAWLVVSVATAVLVVADTRAVPVSRLVSRLLSGDEPWRGLVGSVPGTARGHLLAAAAAAVVLVLAARPAAAGVPPLRWPPRSSACSAQLAGHAGAVADQDVVATGIVVHVAAAAIWVGGLVGVLVHLRRAPALRAAALERFSPLAGGAYLALAVSGAASASVHLATWSAWSSGYAALVLAKVVLLALLGWCGALHRRRLRRDLAYGGRAVFTRLAVAEVALMAVAGGLAGALSRTPLPVVAVAPEHGSSHPGLPAVVQPVSAWLLLGAVRPNALALLVVGGLLVAYRLAVHRVVAAGGSWPEQRLHAATAAAVLAVVVLCSGLATYAPAMLSVQVLQLLLMLLVVPAVVVRAAAARLWRRPVDPVVGAVAVGGLLVLVYRTPLLEASQRSHWVHLTLLLAATAAGTYHLSALAPHGGGGEQAPRQVAGGAARLASLLPAACLGVLGAQLLLGDRLVAGRWFLELRWGWVDPAADQRLAGLLALVAAAGMLLAVVAVRPGAVAQDTGQIRTSTSPSRSSAGTGP
ncbi:cytochrome c oxidase assembly protein [Nocardioides okcheonensis]|uniref:cytochrome c oxidase assembly protein n=1 Tax=Nocardioides okcheonensis TaxID=2894081 RepID=UPI001E3FF93D|nr:cytochrome c oxidase assembly protein [Nocardioides okcheonensis]UFN46649.1 cytochrome c oxidase assembly protein [Nocardioides okcheonensis]